MTTGRINQVASPYKLNKRWVFFSLPCEEKRKRRHTSRSHCKHPCLQHDFVHSVWRFEITRFQKLNLRFQTKCRVPPFLTEEKVEKYYWRLILVVYLNRSLVAEITVLNNSTLNSPQTWIEIRWGLRFNSAQLRCEVGIMLRLVCQARTTGLSQMCWFILMPKGYQHRTSLFALILAALGEYSVQSWFCFEKQSNLAWTFDLRRARISGPKWDLACCPSNKTRLCLGYWDFHLFTQEDFDVLSYSIRSCGAPTQFFFRQRLGKSTDATSSKRANQIFLRPRAH